MPTHTNLHIVILTIRSSDLLWVCSKLLRILNTSNFEALLQQLDLPLSPCICGRQTL